MINFEEKWWQKYRDVKHKSRHQLSLEVILKNSFRENLKEYLKNSSLSSIKQIFADEVPVKHRLTWIILLGLTFFGIGYFLKYLWLDTLLTPLIVTMDSTTYPISKIDFPAVAICNVNRISRKMIKIVAREVKQTLPDFHNASTKEVEWFIQQGGRLLDFDYDEIISKHRLFGAPNRATYDTKRIIRRMEQLAPNCSEMLLKCRWAGSIADCSSIFTVRRTGRGHCCVFNYVLPFNSAGNHGHGSASTAIDEVKKQKWAGYEYGLAVILDPLLDDYAYPIRLFKGFEIYIFDPTHFPDPSTGRVVQRTIQPNNVVLAELQSTKQIATAEVRKYPLSIRKCLFRDEIPELFSNMYSHSACLVQCRIRTVLKLCRCVPYYLPTENARARICTIDDLQCLNKYKEKLINLYPFDATSFAGLDTELQASLYCPECLPDCEFTRHNTKPHWVPVTLPQFPQKGMNYSFTRGINMTNRCLLMVFQSSANGILDRLDVVAYWFEILSNIGGFAGMLVGFSLMCIVEIAYYLVVRLAIVFWRNCKMHY